MSEMTVRGSFFCYPLSIRAKKLICRPKTLPERTKTPWNRTFIKCRRTKNSSTRTNPVLLRTFHPNFRLCTTVENIYTHDMMVIDNDFH